MNVEYKNWRTEFNLYPDLDVFSRPHCIQRSTAYPGYSIDCRTRSVLYSVFQYTLSGLGQIEIEGTKHLLPAGTGFLINVKNAPIIYHSAEGQKEPWNFIFIAMLNTDKYVEDINARFGMIFKVQLQSWLVRTLFGYQNKAGALCMLSPGKAHMLVQSVMSELADSASIQSNQSTGKVFDAVSELVLNHLEKRLSLADIAAMLKISREHLARTFKNETGMTVLQYIQSEQLRYARELLFDRSLLIKEIAYRLGYDNPAHFNRLFKAQTGMTPKEFRCEPESFF